MSSEERLRQLESTKAKKDNKEYLRIIKKYRFVILLLSSFCPTYLA